MLMVDQYEYIRTAHRVYGKKIREITRETGHSRNTIKKALRPIRCTDAGVQQFRTGQPEAEEAKIAENLFSAVRLL